MTEIIMAIAIEYENDDILVINKPAGLPVYSTKKNSDEESVLKWFLAQYPAAKTVGEFGRPGVVHRLDKQTSGLLVLAKTQAGYDFLGKLFRSREISKEYIALVYGKISKHGIIDNPLTKIGQEGRSKVRADKQGKAAVTEYWTEKHYQYGLDYYTLIKVRLHTGRTHQIRVHLADVRHPVMGDSLYGKPESQKLSEILSRQFLHALKIEFKLPDGTWLEVEAELPDDLQKVLQALKIVN
jgi:23S rRNA pseudouridine1911/1915/1917 synthase